MLQDVKMLDRYEEFKAQYVAQFGSAPSDQTVLDLVSIEIKRRQLHFIEEKLCGRSLSDLAELVKILQPYPWENPELHAPRIFVPLVPAGTKVINLDNLGAKDAPIESIKTKDEVSVADRSIPRKNRADKRAGKKR